MSDDKSNPIQVPARGPDGEDRGQLEIDAAKLDDRVRYRLLGEAIRMYLANRRQGTHSTKTRAKVAGSGKKPWRQKGTGRARPGSRKSPIWRGGGVVFGPSPRDYSYSMNRKQRQVATRSSLYSKFADDQVVVLEGLALEGPKTKTVAAALKAVGAAGRCLIGTAAMDANLVLSVRNLRGVTARPLADFNSYEVLEAKTVVLTREAFDLLQENGWPSASVAEAEA